MKRILLPAALLLWATTVPAQETELNDSLKMYRLQEVEVTAIRAEKKMPVVYDNLSGETISKNNYALDMPSMLALTPSLVATNETGIGIGSTSMRLRGSDAKRLNVTVNGVSLNNPDSHAVFWYDTPDLASSVGSIQVQRGAGISTNGTGAFGGAINMTTDALPTEFGGEASFTYGSYNTNKQSVQISSGLLGGHWSVDARISHIGSDGYIDRGATDLKSYMFQGGYYNGSTMLKLVSFGGKARTYLTYQGATKDEMAQFGRRYHSSGAYDIFSRDENGNFIFNAEGDKMVSAQGYYKDHTDNYLQINNQLVLSHRFNNKWSLNATAFYTYGYGFYKQYKGDEKLYKYLDFADAYTYEKDPDGNFILDGEGGKIKMRRDIIRSKKMRNHTGGLNGAMHYNTEELSLSFGASYSYYTCPHWGIINWIDGMDASLYDGRKWYENDASKHDANIFARANWQVVKNLRLFADLQFRAVDYNATGANDNYVSHEVGMQPISVDKRYYFFNPHVGLSYELARHHQFHFSFSIAQKEPTRDDFTDRYMFAETNTYPLSEKLFDYELGYTYSSERFSASANFYYMKYDNQLVPTGRINDSYDALNDNVKDSYRRGIEISAAWKATRWLTASANATFSQNRVENYVNRVVDYATSGQIDGAYDYYVQEMGTTRLAYSPKTIANVSLDFHHKGFSAVLNTQYVSKQYFTNYENPDMRLDAYCVTHLNLGYTLRTRAAREIRFGIMIYNLFDKEYESNGYGWSEAYDGEVTNHAYYFAQAPLHALANVTVTF